MMATVKLAKQALRKDVKVKVAALSDEEKRRQSDVVIQLLLNNLEWKKSERISLFLSMKDEIQTNDILKAAWSQNKQLFIPRYVGSSMDMLRLYSEQDYDSLPETVWKIKQPSVDDTSREEAIATGGLDLVLMPGLAFSPQGQRLGRGKGYYDTFLHRYVEKLGKSPRTIALAFTEQIYESVPVHEHDMLVDIVLYEGCTQGK